MDILVYANWKRLETPTLMGVLSITHTRGHAVFTFSYDKLWIKTDNAQNLDPDLQLYDGPQFLAGSKPNFGLFLDSSPDRSEDSWYRSAAAPCAACTDVKLKSGPSSR